MSDTNIDNAIRRNQVSALPVAKISGAQSLMPVSVAASGKRSLKMMDHQKTATDAIHYVEEVAVEGDLRTDELQATPHEGTRMCARFLLPNKDCHVSGIALEFPVTTGTASAAAFLPAFLWIDRLECRAGNGTPFQTIYGDMMLRLALMALPPEKLFHISLNTFYWFNPPNLPGLSFTSFATAPGSDTEYYMGNQMITAACSQGVIYPWQPVKTAWTNYQSHASSTIMVRIPLYGLWTQQIGAFSLNWFTDEHIEFQFFFRGNPVYNLGGITSGQSLGSLSTTTFKLRLDCVSFPPGHLDETWSGQDELHAMILDQAREDYSQSLTANTPFTFEPKTTFGRHISGINFIFQSNPLAQDGSNYGNGHHLDSQASGSSPLPSHTLTNTTLRCALGDNTADGPSIELLGPGGESVLGGSGQSPVRLDYLKGWLYSRLYSTNPWLLGVVPGQRSYAPFWFTDVPLHFGSQDMAVMGINNGSLQLPRGSSFRFRPTTNVSATVTRIRMYYTYWKHIVIRNGRLEELGNLPLSSQAIKS